MLTENTTALGVESGTLHSSAEASAAVGEDPRSSAVYCYSNLMWMFGACLNGVTLLIMPNVAYTQQISYRIQAANICLYINIYRS
jgi:hypothetical protein